MAVFYGNDAFSIVELSTEEWYSGFLKKVFVWRKICFKVKILKTLRISTDFHKRNTDLSNRVLV